MWWVVCQAVVLHRHLMVHDTVFTNAQPHARKSTTKDLLPLKDAGVLDITLLADTTPLATRPLDDPIVDRRVNRCLTDDEARLVWPPQPIVVCSDVKQLAQARRLGATTLWLNEEAAAEEDGRGGYLAYAIVRDLADAVVGGTDQLLLGAELAVRRFAETERRRRADEEESASAEGARDEPVMIDVMAEATAPEAGGVATKFCVYCGARLPTAARFCSECGEKQPALP